MEVSLLKQSATARVTRTSRSFNGIVAPRAFEAGGNLDSFNLQIGLKLGWVRLEENPRRLTRIRAI